MVGLSLDDLRGIDQLFLPGPLPDSEFARKIGYERHDQTDSQKRFSDWYIAQPEHRFRFQLIRGPQEGWAHNNQVAVDYPCPADTQQISYRLTWQGTAPTLTFSPGARTPPEHIIGPRVRERVMVLLPPGITGHAFNVGQNQADAGNLGDLLLQLQKRTAAMNRFKQQVREIAPEVKDITVDPAQKAPLIWLYDAETERDDLAIPLPECGQGLKYILAITYILFAEEHSRIILIDEIQGLLHPGALRKLFEKFRDQSRHQFILTSNSPMVIAGARPDRVVVVRRGDHGSSLEALTGDSVADQRAILLELGASLSDVFGADGVVWVEGPTDAECFELILAKCGLPLRGIVFLPVRATGDFDGGVAELVCDIYRRLTAIAGLVPTRVAFVFDDEGRTEGKKAEIRTQLDGNAHFLPRRMYENYLLNASAIASYLEAFGIHADAAEINGHLENVLARRTDRRVYPDGCPGDDPIACVHAGNVIEDIFSQFGQAKIAYKPHKRAVAIHLTNWLLEHESDPFSSLVAFLRPVLEGLR
jgi:hypothetical protein